MKTVRNVAIILLIAAAVDLIPGGGRAASTIEATLVVGFGIAFGFLGLRLYRERRVSIYALGDRHRALLYGGVALGFFGWAARARMWESSLGELVWFALVALVVYALMEVFRHSRTY